MNKSKKFMLVSIITLIIAVIGSAGTYAWYVWSTGDDEQVKIVTNVGAATIYYDGGDSITDVKLRPVSDKSKGFVKTIDIKSSTSSSLEFNLYLDINLIDANLKHESFRYALYKGSSTTPAAEGNFSTAYLNSNTSSCTVNDGVKHIQLLTNEPVTTTLTTYTLYIWIDGANYENPTEMAGKNFSFNLHASGENAIVQEGKIPDISQTIDGSASHDFVSMYIAADKTKTVNNGVTYYLDTTNHLMSDIAGNLRFYGPNDSVNNYIHFNCETYPDTNCELWRIIGVFDGKLKIIRDESIGEYSWDNKNTITGFSEAYGSNNWANARLMRLLNPGYENYVDKDNSGNDVIANNSLYWNAGNGNCYSGQNNATVTCDFTSSGLKNDTTREMISESTWYLGGYSSFAVYSNEMYRYERTYTLGETETGTTVHIGNEFTINAKTGLMYLSDYGYATDLSKCSDKISAYNSSTNSYACRTNNWLFNGDSQWTITNRSVGITSAFYVLWTGDSGQNYVYRNNGVRPVVYLDSELAIDFGNKGSSGDPYTINVS